MQQKQRPYVLAIFHFRDIMRSTKTQLEIANASSAAKSAFLFNMSHDIRTPMNAIIGFTELLEKHLDNKELAKSYIKKIQTSNDFLLSLVNHVLEMARIESGKTTLDETYWDAYTFNDTLFSLFDSQMKEKGIEFTRTSKVQHPDVLEFGYDAPVTMFANGEAGMITGSSARVLEFRNQ